jgi:hypothetical protein
MNAQEKKNWLFVFGWVALIYATLPVMPLVSRLLREVIPFTPVVNTLLIGILAGILWRGFRNARPSSVAALFCIAGIYLYFIMTMRITEEKIHFIQYGVLGYLLYEALRSRLQGWRLYAGAFVLTSVLGAIDEGLQYILPGRYYQLEDIFLNILSGALALALIWVYDQPLNQ